MASSVIRPPIGGSGTIPAIGSQIPIFANTRYPGPDRSNHKSGWDERFTEGQARQIWIPPTKSNDLARKERDAPKRDKIRTDSTIPQFARFEQPETQ